MAAGAAAVVDDAIGRAEADPYGEASASLSFCEGSSPPLAGGAVDCRMGEEDRPRIRCRHRSSRLRCGGGAEADGEDEANDGVRPYDRPSLERQWVGVASSPERAGVGEGMPRAPCRASLSRTPAGPEGEDAAHHEAARPRREAARACTSAVRKTPCIRSREAIVLTVASQNAGVEGDRCSSGVFHTPSSDGVDRGCGWEDMGRASGVTSPAWPLPGHAARRCRGWRETG